MDSHSDRTSVPRRNPSRQVELMGELNERMEQTSCPYYASGMVLCSKKANWMISILLSWTKPTDTKRNIRCDTVLCSFQGWPWSRLRLLGFPSWGWSWACFNSCNPQVLPCALKVATISCAGPGKSWVIPEQMWTQAVCQPLSVSLFQDRMSVRKPMERTEKNPDFLLQVMTCIKKTLSFLCFTVNS